MAISDFEKFNEIEKACGSRYLAVQFVAQSARKLGKENKVYCISESKLIQWVLTGECPYTKAELDKRKAISENIDNINYYLDNVDDEFVCDKVRECYKASIRNRKLTYCKDTNISPGKQSRINILLRMIWYQFTIE